MPPKGGTTNPKGTKETTCAPLRTMTYPPSNGTRAYWNWTEDLRSTCKHVFTGKVSTGPSIQREGSLSITYPATTGPSIQREGSLSNTYPALTLKEKDANVGKEQGPVVHTSAERSIPPATESLSEQEYHKEMRNVYLEAKMQFERASAQLRQEKKREREGSEDRQLEKKLKLDLAAV